MTAVAVSPSDTAVITTSAAWPSRAALASTPVKVSPGPCAWAATCSAAQASTAATALVPDPFDNTFTAAPLLAPAALGAFHPLQLEPLPHRGRVAPCHIERLGTSQPLGPQFDHSADHGHDHRARALVSHHRAGLARHGPQRLGHHGAPAVVLRIPAFNIVFSLPVVRIASRAAPSSPARRTASFADLPRGTHPACHPHWPPDARGNTGPGLRAARARAAAFPARWTVAVRRARRASRILRPPAGWSRLAATSARTSRTDLAGSSLDPRPLALAHRLGPLKHRVPHRAGRRNDRFATAMPNTAIRAA